MPKMSFNIEYDRVYPYNFIGTRILMKNIRYVVIPSKKHYKSDFKTNIKPNNAYHFYKFIKDNEKDITMIKTFGDQTYYLKNCVLHNEEDYAYIDKDWSLFYINGKLVYSLDWKLYQRNIKIQKIMDQTI